MTMRSRKILRRYQSKKKRQNTYTKQKFDLLKKHNNIYRLYSFKSTYESVLIRNIVSEFKLMERDDFMHPLLASRRRIRMNVHSFRHFRISFASNDPATILELVPTIVARHDVHQHHVLRLLIKTG